MRDDIALLKTCDIIVKFLMHVLPRAAQKPVDLCWQAIKKAATPKKFRRYPPRTRIYYVEAHERHSLAIYMLLRVWFLRTCMIEDAEDGMEIMRCFGKMSEEGAGVRVLTMICR